MLVNKKRGTGIVGYSVLIQCLAAWRTVTARSNLVFWIIAGWRLPRDTQKWSWGGNQRRNGVRLRCR